MSMVLRYYGYARAPWQIAADFDKGPDDGLGIFEIGTLENYLETYYDRGATDAWRSETYYNNNSLVARLQEIISEEHPVWLACIDEGHAIVITGFDGVGDTDHVYVNDPSGYITGSPYMHHEYTWANFKTKIDTTWFSPFGDASILYGQTANLLEVPSVGSIQVQPYTLYFKNSAGGTSRQLFFDWDGREPYSGYFYEPSASGMGWYTADSDGSYDNYKYNATQTDTLNLRASYSNYANPGDTYYLRTRAEIRKASDGTLIDTILSGVDAVTSFRWLYSPGQALVTRDLADLASGVYSLVVKLEGNTDNGTLFSELDQCSLYFGVTASLPVIASLQDTPDPATQGETVTLTANGVSDPDGTVAKVEFYRDSNGNGALDMGVDTKLGEDASSVGGWTWSGSSSGFALGTNKYFARAQDDDGAWGNAAMCIGVVNPQPTLSITDVSMTEGNSGTKNFNFTVSLSPASSQTVMVNYGTANNSAIAPGDYTPVSGTLTFTVGQTSKTVFVPVKGDATYEPNEEFWVLLSGATSATISDNKGVGTIRNDDFGGPRVDNVLVSSPSWDAGFLATLGGQGYSIPTGPDQLATLPWTNIDQVKVVFSEDVNVSQGNLSIHGINVPDYAIAGFNYDGGSLMATWTLSGPVAADKLLLTLLDDVTDMAGNHLDGEWTDGDSAFPSGNDAEGGDFQFRLNVLPGDADSNYVVGSGDLGTLVSQFGLRGNGLVADFNADGWVDLDDFAIIRNNFGNTLPVPAPVGAPVAALPAAGEPIAGAAAPMIPIVSQPLDGRDANNANDDSIATISPAPAVDLLTESFSVKSYIPVPQLPFASLPATTFHRAATDEYDLRPLCDDPASDGEGDDLLADILAESPLAVPL